MDIPGRIRSTSEAPGYLQVVRVELPRYISPQSGLYTDPSGAPEVSREWEASRVPSTQWGFIPILRNSSGIGSSYGTFPASRVHQDLTSGALVHQFVRFEAIELATVRRTKVSCVWAVISI